MLKEFFLFFSILIFISACGGGGTSSNSPSASEPTIIGLQGDLNAIEPIDLD